MQRCTPAGKMARGETNGADSVDQLASDEGASDHAGVEGEPETGGDDFRASSRVDMMAISYDGDHPYLMIALWSGRRSRWRGSGGRLIARGAMSRPQDRDRQPALPDPAAGATHPRSYG